jgi:glycosyltransferase involved in cell wall biosynthesis
MLILSFSTMNNSKETFISFIVPCYNYGQFLAECLDSIRLQSFEAWECLIIDNGSTDNTKEVAAQFTVKDFRFKYHFIEQQGVSFARNFGIRHSNGKYILPVDADDKIATSYARKAFDILERSPAVKVVYSDAELFGASSGKWILPEYSLRDMLVENSIFSSAMYRRADFDRSGGYNENMREGFEDWDFWIRMLKDGAEVYKIPEVLFYYRIRASSRNNSLDHERQLMLRRRIYENHRDVYERIYNMPEILFNNYGLKRQLKSVEDSREYRFGKMILSPLRRLKNLFKG